MPKQGQLRGLKAETFVEQALEPEKKQTQAVIRGITLNTTRPEASLAKTWASETPLAEPAKPGGCHWAKHYLLGRRLTQLVTPGGHEEQAKKARQKTSKHWRRSPAGEAPTTLNETAQRLPAGVTNPTHRESEPSRVELTRPEGGRRNCTKGREQK